MKISQLLILLAIVFAISGQSQAANILVNPRFAAVEDSGEPLTGGCLYSYDCGTTDKSATCADYLCSSDNDNPIELDARGEADLYTDQCFKLALYEADPDGTCDSRPSTPLIWTQDNINQVKRTAEDGATILDPGTDGTDATLIASILANDGTEVLENGTDGTDATFTGGLVSPSIILNSYNFYSEYLDIRLATYDSKSKDVNPEDISPQSIFFKPDGASMYVLGLGSRTVYQYTLSTPWDVSTAAYASKFKSVVSQESSPRGLFFSPTGGIMYVVGNSTATVYQYTLSTAWDVSTAAYASKSKVVSTEDTIPQSLSFSSNGSEMFILGTLNSAVYQYDLTTAYDVSTADYSSESFSVSSEGPIRIFFNSSGRIMYASTLGSIFRYVLSVPWDIRYAYYTSKFADVSAENAGNAVFLKPDGSKMYSLESSINDVVHQYSLDTTSNVLLAY
jgi:sugar lactone lactonase YvrE